MTHSRKLILKLLITVVLAVHVSTTTVMALDLSSMRPRHDWTIDIGDAQCGIQGDGHRTDVVMGSLWVSLPLPFFATVGLGALLSAGVALQLVLRTPNQSCERTPGERSGRDSARMVRRLSTQR